MSIPAGAMADVDEEMWDTFLDAMRLNRLQMTAEEFGAEAARDILVAIGLIPGDSPDGVPYFAPSPPK